MSLRCACALRSSPGSPRWPWPLPLRPPRGTVTDGTRRRDEPACNATRSTCASLRAALAASEATKEVPDTINVPAGHDQHQQRPGDPVATSRSSGRSARTTIIDGGAKYRGFRVTASGNAKISHFTVRNGAAGQGDSPDGGGILNLGGIVALDHVRVTGSRAPEGARRRDRELPRQPDCSSAALVDNNTAGDGAGIANIGGPEAPDRGFLFDQRLDRSFRNTAADRRHRRDQLAQRRQPRVAARRDARRQRRRRARRRRHLAGQQRHAGRSVRASIARNTSSATTSINCGGTLSRTDDGGNVEDDKDCDFDVGSGADRRPRDRAAQRRAASSTCCAIRPTSPAVDRGPRASCTRPGRPTPAGSRGRRGRRCDSGAYELDRRADGDDHLGPDRDDQHARRASSRSASTEPGVTLPVPARPGRASRARLRRVLAADAQPYSGLANGSLHVLGARAGRRVHRARRSRHALVHGRHALDTTITGGPSGADQRHHADLHVHRRPAAPRGSSAASTARRSRAARSPFTTGDALAEARTRSPVRALERRRERRPDAGVADVHGRHGRAGHDDRERPDRLGELARARRSRSRSNESGVDVPVLARRRRVRRLPAPATPASSQGAHTFQVRATDAAGNIDARPTSRTWTVDTIAPEHDDHRPGRAARCSTHQRDVHVHLQRGRRDVPVLARRRRLRRLPRRLHRPRAGRAHLPGPRHRRRRQHRRTRPTRGPGRSTRPRRNTTITDRPDRRGQLAPARRSRSPPTKPARRSSARSTAPPSAPAPPSYTGLAQGAHTFQVRASDAAGNVDARPTRGPGPSTRSRPTPRSPAARPAR